MQKNKRLIILLSVAGTLLLLPIAAMQFKNEVNWNIFDFLLAGVLLFGAILSIELILRKLKSKTIRIALIAALLFLLVLIWLELAIGIFEASFGGN